MAIISRGVFGGVTLTGQESKSFVERMRNPRHNPKLTVSVERGEVHLARMRAAEGSKASLPPEKQ